MIKDKLTAIVGSIVGCVILLTIFCCEGKVEETPAVEATPAIEEVKEVIPTEAVTPVETVQ